MTDKTTRQHSRMTPKGKPRNFFAEWNRMNQSNLRRMRRGRQASIGIYGVMMDEIDKTLRARSQKRKARFDQFVEAGETLKKRALMAISEELHSAELSLMKADVEKLKTTLKTLQETAQKASYEQPLSPLPPISKRSARNGYARAPH